MEKEINLVQGKLALNVYFTEELSQLVSEELELLLKRALLVLDNKLESDVLANLYPEPGKVLKRLESNLNIVSDAEIQKINNEYRQKDYATDVLSFPLQENLRRGEFDHFDGHLELGDMFVATGVCERQASENSLSFEQEFVHLFVHGLLHLCGYDHEENEAEDALMRGLEDRVMQGISRN